VDHCGQPDPRVHTGKCSRHSRLLSVSSGSWRVVHGVKFLNKLQFLYELCLFRQLQLAAIWWVCSLRITFTVELILCLEQFLK
jgi:hypothetical protein